MRETRTSGSMRGRERAVIGLGLSSRAFSLYSTSSSVLSLVTHHNRQ
jgi:hypothetical protein